LFSKALLQTQIFQNKDSLVDALVRYVRIDGCNPEAVLVRQGDSGQSMFILAIGEVAVSVQNLEGVEQCVRSLKSGKFFGEVALLTGSKRTATVTAVNFCTFGVLSKPHLLDLIGKFPSVKESILQHICQEYKDEQRTMVVERLAALPFSLTETDRILLFYAMQNCFFGKTQVVSPKGLPPGGLLVTVSGQLSITMKLDQRDWQSTVLTLPPGSLCFCASFLTQDPLIIEVTATEATFAYRLEKQAFESKGNIEFLEKDPKGTGAKYVEKVLTGSGVVMDFIRSYRLHHDRKSLRKKLKLSVLGLCQSSYGKRRKEMNSRVSSLLELLTNYMKINKRGGKTDTYDFVQVLQSVIQTTTELKNRVEVLTNEYVKLVNK
jgi:CRP-like cAMP-binding protein